jgi:hypothetical protein
VVLNSKILVSKELERMCKEAVMMQLMVFSKHFLKGLRKTTKSLC